MRRKSVRLGHGLFTLLSTRRLHCETRWLARRPIAHLSLWVSRRFCVNEFTLPHLPNRVFTEEWAVELYRTVSYESPGSAPSGSVARARAAAMIAAALPRAPRARLDTRGHVWCGCGTRVDRHGGALGVVGCESIHAETDEALNCVGRRRVGVKRCTTVK